MTAVPDEREARSARNQSMFRGINEKLTHDDPLSEMTSSHVIVCECADPTCVQTLAISVAQYQQVREQPRTFAVLRDHIDPSIERVVAEFRTFVVVEKFGDAGEVAEILED